jgi:phosphomannomutase
MVTALFPDATLTRIGSPYVIAGMEAARASDRQAKVVGFEANGGFLLGFAADGPAGPLAALDTRDSLLPILAPLAAARRTGQDLAALVAALPPRFTAADRLQEIDRDKAGAFLAQLDAAPDARAAFLASLGREKAVDRTDGLRMMLEGDRVIHLRPSGNAPEFRVYVEAETPEAARDLLAQAMAEVARQIGASK